VPKTLRSPRWAVYSFVGLFFLLVHPALAQLIDVDFNNDSYGATHGGPNPGPTMSGAAVLGAAGDLWNGINTASGSGVSLFYATGSSSPVTMTFTSGGGYDAKSFGGATPFAGTPYDALMEDYLFNSGVPQTITLSGLATNAIYDLVLYNAADNSAGAVGRTTSFTVNGNTQSSVWNATSSTLVAGVDYVEFASALSDGSGNLVITYTGSGSAEGDVDGFQIKAVPPTPTVSIASPTNGAVFIAPANVSIMVNAAVSSGTVTNVWFFANGISLGAVLTSPFDLTASNLTAGAYTLEAVATAAGVTATSTVVNVTVAGQVGQANNAAAYTWTTLAGTPSYGSADGVGGTIQFASPSSVALDTNGNVYVADTGNNTIRKITPAGVSSTIAGLAGIPGSADGMNSSARFNAPLGVALDSAGNLYVTDNDIIRKMTLTGTNWMVITIAGAPPVYDPHGGPNDQPGYHGGYADGMGTNAQFSLPNGIIVDSATNLYVTDSGNGVIRKLTPSGTNWMVTTLAGSTTNSGSADGTNGSAQFFDPTGIAMDGSTNLYVMDFGNNTIRKIKPSGTNWIVTTLAGSTTVLGGVDGTNGSAQFRGPHGVAIDSATNLYVTDFGNCTIRKMRPSGTNWVVTTIAGSVTNAGSADGTATNALFDYPQGIALDSMGNLYVADTGNNTIRKITSAGVVRTLAGLPPSSSAGSADGTGSAAQFNYPEAVTVDSAGDIDVADTLNDTIRQISSAGEVSTIAGNATIMTTNGSVGFVAGGTNDGVGNFARFNSPSGVAVDSALNIYVADQQNDTIRKITPAGAVSTIAGLAQFNQFGNEIGGTNDGIGSNARFNLPSSITVDKATNLYVTDLGSFTIRKVTPVGTNWVVSTIAGQPAQFVLGSLTGGSADGTNNAALFYYPEGIAVDNAGNLYVADSFNDTIRKITPVGTNWVVTTIAGFVGSSGSTDGTGSNARFNEPSSIDADSAGNLYVTDGDSIIRKLTPVGTNWVVTTIGGLARIRGNTDGAGSAALFNDPSGITVDNSDDLYVADTGNDTIRKGVFTAYNGANEMIAGASGTNGALSVTLLPPEANGQWRFGWETGWRDSGTTASNLVAGNYPVEFSSVPGYLTIQTNFIAVVTEDATSYITNQYYPTVNGGAGSVGTLTVDITPEVLSGTGWRFLGETNWFASGSTATNLLPGVYDIEFEPVTNYAKPSSEAVEVYAGVPTFITAGYLLASTPPGGVLFPFPVPVGEIGDVADYPFGFNGQLQSDVGYGSGVAVQTNVVLTAAHMVFNDQTLSYVSQVYWYFQEEAGASALQPQAARGWYVLSGYAAQRTNDIFGGLAPGQSTPQSRDFDVAALYFLSPVAGGGYGGYLPSDEAPNSWLTGNSLKMLAGYPVDGSEFGNASIVPGEMYQTQPQPYALNLATDPVNDQQVYTASWFLSYSGNSGGPLYVQYNGYYYPAGVYLGTLYNGVTPYASAVRAIDSDVVGLITNAAALGDSGTNHTGGGVITIIPNQAISASRPGYLQFLLGPAGALAAGAAWELQGDPAYSTATNYVRVVTTTNAVAVVFKPIPGWSLPTNQLVNVLPGQVTTYNALYLVNSPVMVFSGKSIGLTGTTGTVYRIEGRASLSSGSWLPISTNTITSGGVNVVLPNPATNGAAMFYRAVWLQ
jgi:hypothetical protein